VLKKVLALSFSILGIAAAVHATTPKDFEQTLEYMSAEEMRTLLKTLEGTEDGLLLARKIQEIEVDENPLWTCPTCNSNEKYVLEQLQVKAVHQYMVGAYYWLGWGIKGPREQYAYNYVKKLVLS
jgi:hypothetical protein